MTLLSSSSYSPNLTHVHIGVSSAMPPSLCCWILKGWIGRPKCKKLSGSSGFNEQRSENQLFSIITNDSKMSLEPLLGKPLGAIPQQLDKTMMLLKNRVFFNGFSEGLSRYKCIRFLDLEMVSPLRGY